MLSKVPRIIRIGEAAALLGLTAQTIRIYCANGRLRYWLTSGDQYLFDKADILALRDADRTPKLAAAQARMAHARAAKAARRVNR